MARCSSLDEAGRVVGVEDMDEVLVAAELERAFGENPAMSPDGESILSEGRAHTILGRRPSWSTKLRRWRRRVIS
jgi:hypothetical protein